MVRARRDSKTYPPLQWEQRWIEFFVALSVSEKGMSSAGKSDKGLLFDGMDDDQNSSFR